MASGACSRRAPLAAWAFGLSACLAGPPARLAAHHSFQTEFDASQAVRLRGVVTRVAWMNPHAWIYLDVTGADGRATNWAIECGPPGTLWRRGLRKELLPAGAAIEVLAFAALDGAPKANGRVVTLTNGLRLRLESSGPEN